MSTPGLLLLTLLPAGQGTNGASPNEQALRALDLGRAYVALRELPERDLQTYDRRRAPELPRVELRREAASKELAALEGHPWAGSYSYGGGFEAVSIVVTPEAGAVYVRDSDVGKLDWNHGDVVAVGEGELSISWAFDPGLNDPVASSAFVPRPGLSERLFVVPWGDERYLVPSVRMIDFCNAVNAGVAPGRFPRLQTPAREEDPALPQGHPGIPLDHGPFLLERPIEGRVIAGPRTDAAPHEPSSGARVQVEIDVGSSAGLLPGMTVYPDGWPFPGEVLSVEGSSATVEFRLRGFQSAEGFLPEGSRVSTRRNGGRPGW